MRVAASKERKQVMWVNKIVFLLGYTLDLYLIVNILWYQLVIDLTKRVSLFIIPSLLAYFG